MSTAAPIVIEPLWNYDDEDAGAFAMGHHDPELFFSAVREYAAGIGDSSMTSDIEAVDMCEVVHEWWITGPVPDEPDEVAYTVCEPGDPAGDPVTVVRWN